VESIGSTLRAIRNQRQLSLREVEERSLLFAQRRGDMSYKVSASWLDRLEREQHELTVNRLVALADIYSIPAEQLLSSMHPALTETAISWQFSVPNATILLTGGPLEDQARRLLPDVRVPNQPPDETTLLTVEDGLSSVPYRRGIIGKLDRTLDPMIPPGSIVHIDTQKRAISTRKDWSHEFQRPIYFLMTRDAYICGWCELDRTSDWLTVIPHPLSPASSRRWKYRTQIENVGRVRCVSILLTERP
jgi:transcriptional regulator with XRE-family HTH domain